MRLIDADALERDGWRMSRIVQIDEKTMEAQTRKPTDFPTIEPERIRGRWKHYARQQAPLNTVWWYACSVCGGNATAVFLRTFAQTAERKWSKRMSKLKPCPFCGGEATPVYCENGSQYTSNIMYLSKRGTIKCKRCEVRLPRIYSSISKAIEAWNRRTGETPTVEPESQWIPCSERLPEVRRWVLCQCRANIMDVLRLTDDGSWYRQPHTIYMGGFVLAWMPLPEPYQEVENEQS